jgi:hypothetical protein
MANELKALPRRTSSPLDGDGPTGPAPESQATNAPVAWVRPVDFDGTAALSDRALRERAREARDPGVRLAACWRLMVRGQAVPQTEPPEGVRLLTLVNLATQQDLELLEVVFRFDPCDGVRAQAAIFLWRAARDRDRVVRLLLSGLRREASPEVIGQLLALEPGLPADEVRDVVRDHVRHPSEALRRAAWQWWFDRGEPNDERSSDALGSEPSRELRAWCLSRWAEGPDFQSLLAHAVKHPGLLSDTLSALHEAGHSFPIAELGPLLDEHPTEAVLRLAGGPFDAASRRRLVALAGLLPPWQLRGSRLDQHLWGCLRAAYAPSDSFALTDEERAWADGLEAELSAEASPRAAPDDGDDGDGDGYDDEGDDYDEDREDAVMAMTNLLRLLRGAQGEPAPRTP